MKMFNSIILIAILFLVIGCSRENLQDLLARSAPHDASIQAPDASANFENKLMAQGADWTVTVQWNSGELKRFVTWQQGQDGFSLGIPLRIRPAPFTYSDGSRTMTRYGPYQPACVHKVGAKEWHVQMSHEQVDFATEAELMKMLEVYIPGQPEAQPILTPDGIMVILYGPAFSKTTSVGVNVWTLTINGKKPSPSILKPFITGKVTIQPSKTVKNLQGLPAIGQ